MILGILQARVSSSRLPGKVLKPILGRPMILRQIERLQRAQTLDKLVLATSVDPSDDALADLMKAEGIETVRGPLDDVLARFTLAAKPYNPEWIVRLTGDCPLADPEVVDRVVRETIAAKADYGSNALEPTFPDGLDAEVVRGAILEQIASENRTQAEREHVTLAIHRHPECFRLHIVRSATDLSALRWTVDEPADFALVERIYQTLYPVNPAFTTADVLRLLAEHPDLVALNTGIERNEGLARSLAREAANVQSRKES
ncbi:MAG TPA: glycosyltransferase family protein [Alphaproteobacteria bacterium]|jgi:spore coat polysaccharide biosynthesis protein SpsF|nr:glycosyltransferase family protein [Alphaproteobacteria bacterium]